LEEVNTVFGEKVEVELSQISDEATKRPLVEPAEQVRLAEPV
jgi:hypothetical protein